MTRLPSGNYVDLTGKFCLLKLYSHGEPEGYTVLMIEGFTMNIRLAPEDIETVTKIAEARVKENSKGQV